MAVGAYPFLSDNLRMQDAYELVGARIGYERGHFGIYCYGSNLTDTTYFTWALPLGPGLDYLTTPGDPRTFGLMVAARF